MEETTNTPISTRSVGMTFGMYAGLASVALFLILALTGLNPFGNLRWVGLIFSIALLYMAQKKYKDEGDGYMSYGQGMGIGFWYVLVSTVVSLAITYVYIEFIDYSPMTSMLEEQATKMQEQGQSSDAIDVAQTWTKKLFWVFAVIGGLIFGMILPLIVTIFTQKNNQQAEM